MTSTRIALVLLLQILPAAASAAPVSLPSTFTAGTPAKAAEVNANFTALATGLNAQDARIATLETTVASLVATSAAQQASVASLQNDLTAARDRIAVLETRLASVSTLTVNGQPTVRFTGVNVQVVNGAGSTNTVNGTGNLVVGYDEPDGSGRAYCTRGTDPVSGAAVSDETACATAGGTWTSVGFKSGSHYLVGGSQNNYSRWGGVVFGFGNTASYDWAGVTGGRQNRASGDTSSVGGGTWNVASGLLSSVGGGASNAARGGYSSVTGGQVNFANGILSVVSGGDSNTASGDLSAVSGGLRNDAGGYSSSILGGLNQNAANNYQTIPALP